MAIVTAKWSSIGRNYAGLSAFGSDKIRVQWGDGTAENISGFDDDKPQQVDAGHVYASDGVYLVAVKDAFGGPYFSMNAIFFTSDTNDRTITGNSRIDLIIAGSGNDTIRSGAGDDIVAGSDGNDVIYGGDGNDVLIGDERDDLLIGGAGSDLLGGGADNDQLQGGEGTDFLYGDEGNDILFANRSAVIDTFYNYLDGGSGNDRLTGDAGDDLLVGGLGRDTMSGGVGQDIFEYNDILESGKGPSRDILYDFESGDSGDIINLFDLGPLSEIGTAGFTGGGGQVRYVLAGSSTVVQVDIDGDRVSDMEIQLRGQHVLTDHNISTTSDFIV